MKATLSVACLSLTMLWIAAPSAAERSGSGPPDRPNIVLILADDAGVETIGAYGSEYRTPRIDALAGEGVRFENAHSTPLCTPSRVRLLTGRYSFRNYKAFGHLGRDEPTIAKLLKQQGYRTAVAGKWQLAGNPLDGVPGSTPREAGFDEWILWHPHPSQSDAGCRHWTPTLETNGRMQTYPNQFGPDLVNDFALDFISRRDRRPFFLYYSMLLPHDPFVSTPAKRGPGTPAENYAAMIEYMDYLTGAVIDRLDQLDLRNRTLVIFVADNGTHRTLAVRRNGVAVQGGKGETTDAGTHVPLIIRWPGRLRAGVVDSQMVDLTDLFATIVAAGGLTAAASQSDGYDLLPSLTQGTAPRREAIFMDYDMAWFPFNAVRYAFTSRWKLYEDGRLYDMSADPREKSPLAAEGLPAEARAARVKLQGLLASIGGSRLTPSDPHFPKGFDPEKIDYQRAGEELQRMDRECGDPARVPPVKP
jgi:arylsulfatase A